MPTWLIGARTVEDAWAFMRDLADRLSNRVQLPGQGEDADVGFELRAQLTAELVDQGASRHQVAPRKAARSVASSARS